MEMAGVKGGEGVGWAGMGECGFLFGLAWREELSGGALERGVAHLDMAKHIGEAFVFVSPLFLMLRRRLVKNAYFLLGV